ncbi:MAG TPA: GDP-mannose 4,6-dehydratase [Dehalococcoidia bacterium]|nr:GDP-mannose 4,6-dehydratase [Dehalococcoidia bacterium]
MTKCLITGCGGFIGSYLAEFLLTEGLTVYGIVHHSTARIEHLRDRLAIIHCDLLDRERVGEIMTQLQPGFIFHLAAQSLVSSSWEDPETTLRVNILGSLYLLEGVRKAAIEPVVVMMGSSSEYGFSYEDKVPIAEDNRFAPSSPYGVSKIAQDMLAFAYFRGLHMTIVRVRPFYIIGPGKTLDACSDFARGIVRIERGQQRSLKVGNLEAVRDVVDVRDAVRALWLIADKGVPGEAYNLCSGKGYKIGEILDKLISLSGAKVIVQSDSRKMRLADESLLVGDNSKLRRLGWEPRIPLERSLADILDFWRREPIDC